MNASQSRVRRFPPPPHTRFIFLIRVRVQLSLFSIHGSICERENHIPGQALLRPAECKFVDLGLLWKVHGLFILFFLPGGQRNDMKKSTQFKVFVPPAGIRSAHPP